MDRLFAIFAVFVILSGVVIYFAEGRAFEQKMEQTKITSTTLVDVAETTSTTLPSLVSTSTSSTIIISEIVEVTTTTLPPFVPLDIIKVGKCSSTIRGSMNTITAQLTEDSLTGNWGPNPDPHIYYSCDGGERILFDQMFFAGGRGIVPESDVVNSYRLAARCGRTQLTEDLSDCEKLEVVVDTAYVNVDSINQVKADTPVVVVTTTTSTTLYTNPYLDQFRDKGYRKADIDIAWMCPTCVPMVNKLIREQEGVISKRIGYKEDVNYIVYDPTKITLDRVLMLTQAGGTGELIEDYEL